MKFVKIGEDSYRMEMEPSDAREDEITHNIQMIGSVLAGIHQRGFTPDVRAKDRAGYWRYAEVERGLMLIRDGASTALLHIKLLDFPELASAGDPTSIQ